MSQHCDPQDGIREAKLIQEATDGADSVADDLSDWLENLDKDCKDKDVPEIMQSNSEIMQGNDGNHVFESLESLHTDFDTLFKQADISPARSSPRKKRITHKIFPIAAVICIIMLCMATAQAFGVNIFDAIARWTNEQFHFSEDATIPATIGKNSLPNKERKTYESLQEALDKCNVSGQVAPQWVPKRYSLKSAYAIKIYNKTIFCADYVDKKGNTLSIMIRKANAKDFAKAEKNTERVEIFKKAGIKHYLLSDKTCEKANWINNSVEGLIYGKVSRRELKQMINSIYEGK